MASLREVADNAQSLLDEAASWLSGDESYDAAKIAEQLAGMATDLRDALRDDAAPDLQIVRITMEGGVIQDMEVPCGIQVIVHDYDVEGVEVAELQTDENGDVYIEGNWGSPSPA